MIFKRVANERKSSFAARFYFYDAMKKCVAYQRKSSLCGNYTLFLCKKTKRQILCSCKEQSHLLRKQGGLKWQKVTK